MRFKYIDRHTSSKFVILAMIFTLQCQKWKGLGNGRGGRKRECESGRREGGRLRFKYIERHTSSSDDENIS